MGVRGVELELGLGGVKTKRRVCMIQTLGLYSPHVPNILASLADSNNPYYFPSPPPTSLSPPNS